MRGFATPALTGLMLVTAASLVAAACGPSLRRMQRSDVYFERCYAADFDTQVPIEERRACWQSWLEHWQRDQAAPRIDYVRERILRLDPARSAAVALATGDEEIPHAAPEIAREATIVVETTGGDATSNDGSAEAIEPAPAIDVASEPDTSPAHDVGDAPVLPSHVPPAQERRRSRMAPLPRATLPHCAEACRPGWTSCTTRCDEGDHHACLRACRLELRTCTRGCY